MSMQRAVPVPVHPHIRLSLRLAGIYVIAAAALLVANACTTRSPEQERAAAAAAAPQDSVATSRR
jgi:hypothetical protein